MPAPDPSFPTFAPLPSTFKPLNAGNSCCQFCLSGQFSIQRRDDPKGTTPALATTGHAPDAAAMRWLTSLAGYVAPIFLILSPVLSYSDQAMSMHRNKSSAGFSLDIPLIMLIASMFRCVAF